MDTSCNDDIRFVGIVSHHVSALFQQRFQTALLFMLPRWAAETPLYYRQPAETLRYTDCTRGGVVSAECAVFALCARQRQSVEDLEQHFKNVRSVNVMEEAIVPRAGRVESRKVRDFRHGQQWPLPSGA